MNESQSTFISTPANLSIVDLVSRASSCEEANSWPQTSNDLHEAERLFHRLESRLLRMHPDRELLQKRLESKGLTRESAIMRLTSRSMPENEALPNWALFLEKVLCLDLHLHSGSEISSSSRANTESDTQVHFPVFLELARPFINTGLEILESNKLVRRWLEPSAIMNVTTMLRNRISSIAARTLAHELKLRSQAGELLGASPEDRYVDFMKRFVSNREGLLALFGKYPVLARLLATRTLQSIEIIVEIAQRLDADAMELSQRFHRKIPLKKVSKLTLGLSDPHFNGRSVSILEFADDLKIVYKPRSLAIDRAYSKLLDWWNSVNPCTSLKCASVITRVDYGWAEFVESSDCISREDIAKYYERQGAHTALFHFLQSSDFHGENFIAAGEFPVPIDLECILTSTQSQKPLPNLEMPVEFCPPGLIGTGMLPMWKPGINGEICSVNCGIAGHAARPTTETVSVWKGIGTDELALVFDQKSVSEDTSACLPRLEGIVVGPENYLDSLTSGFALAYNTMILYREQLLDDDGPLSQFRGVRTRCLLRTTSEYTFLLSWSTSPDHLTSGAAHDLSFELLATYGAATENSFDLIDVEKRQLWQRDIPVFFGLADGNRIFDAAGKPLDNELPSTSFQQMKSALATASIGALDWQRQIMSSSIRMACDSVVEITKGNESTRTEDPILAEAIRLGECLCKLAIRGNRGATWLTLESEPHDLRALSMDYARDGLYSGSAGIGLFLANLSNSSPRTEFASLAREALAFAVARDAWTHQNWPGYRERVSAFSSTYSTVYALAECGRILDDKRLVQQAVECVEWQNPTPTVDNPDFINGAAGALCVLLHLHALTGLAPLLNRSRHLANAIGCSVRQDGGWKIETHRRPLLGLGHGQVGIAMAMARWATVSGDEQWDTVVAESLAYEARNFDPVYGNWPNFQSNELEPQFLIGWCGGAPGHGLARLNLLKWMEKQKETNTQLEAAISIAKKNAGPGPENLCCGKPGTLWFLSEAGRQQNRPELSELACHQALAFISDRHERGGWYLRPIPERDTLPTLMGGIAGIGLSLLQVRSPGKVSQVVTLS